MGVHINLPTNLRTTVNIKPVHLPAGLRVLRAVRLPHKLGLRERLHGPKLARNGVCWVVCAHGVEWKLDFGDATQRWIVFGDYEGPVFLNWIRRWIEPGGAVVDSGAKFGQALLYFAALPNVRVIAFKPLPEAMRWLEECVNHDPDAWPVTLVVKGLSDEAGLVELKLWGPQLTMRSSWCPARQLETLSVEVDALDNQLDRLGIDHVRLWKLDVEGFEVEALRGAKRSLRQSPKMLQATTNLLALSPGVDKEAA